MTAAVEYQQGKNFSAGLKTDLIAFTNSTPNVRLESTINVADTPFSILAGLNYKTDAKVSALLC